MMNGATTPRFVPTPPVIQSAPFHLVVMTSPVASKVSADLFHRHPDVPPGAPPYAHTLEGRAERPLKSIWTAAFQPEGIGRKSPAGGGGGGGVTTGGAEKVTDPSALLVTSYAVRVVIGAAAVDALSDPVVAIAAPWLKACMSSGPDISS